MSGNHDPGDAHRPCKYCIYFLPPLTSSSSSAVFLPLHISEIQLVSSPKRSSNSLACAYTTWTLTRNDDSLRPVTAAEFRPIPTFSDQTLDPKSPTFIDLQVFMTTGSCGSTAVCGSDVFNLNFRILAF